MSCSVTGLWPLPDQDELARHYANYYLTRTSDAERQDRLVDLHRGIVEYLLGQERLPARPSFLDYGFGSGSFLRCVARLGHQATGADVSSQNVVQLRETAARDGLAIDAIELTGGSLAALAGRRYDVVTLFQVIEHVLHPLELVSELSRLQAPGGLLYIECPNDDAVWAGAKTVIHRALKHDSWNSLKHPEHLHGFNRRAITSLLASAGYDTVEVGDYGYRDGLHQVESEFWWPKLGHGRKGRSVSGVVRSAIPLFDRLMSAGFKAGSGLFALGRRDGKAVRDTSAAC
jgi:2-polyprenyl-3-methyl-5-hydroxy-6-metoxy-1,4-benzoquinol methylase